MNSIQIFNNAQFGDIRVGKNENGEPLFVARDICEILGILNYRDAIMKLDDDDRGYVRVDTLGGLQEMAAVTESGVYTLTIRSDKVNAKPFKNWVTKEVLPSIRKHGAYLTAEKIEEVLTNPDTIIRLATNLKNERQEKERYRLQAELQSKELKESAPKIEYYDDVLQSDTAITTNVIAKELGMSAWSLNKILASHNIIYRSGKTWVLYAKYENQGYTKTKTHRYTDENGIERTHIHTYWTEEGREFIHRIVKEIGRKIV